MTVPNLMYIDGEWTPASDGAKIEIINPADEEKIDNVPVATKDDLDSALESADKAWRSWKDVDAWTRSAKIRRVSDIIKERVEEIAAVLTEEQGKPIAEARAEIGAAAEQFDWYADETRRIYGRVIDGHSKEHRILVVREPIGPVAAFSPWNFPALLSARKIAPAIACGCSIIVKPAVEAPRTALCMAKAVHDAGIPAGVLNMVTGKSSMISDHLIKSDIIRKVTLTGSVTIGQEILRLSAAGIKVVTMELGGHSPVLVFEDANIDQAAELCAKVKYRNNGQVCIAASRFYVQESVAKRFIDKFVEVTKSLVVGDGRDPKTDLGPIANKRRLDATESVVSDAVKKGATVKCGGKRPEGFDRGFYYEPTVITDVDNSMEIMTEEPFCPVAPISTFSDIEDGLTKANETEFGLAAYLFTENMKTMFLAAEGIESGMVGVNTLLLAAPEIPFGGIKKSGYGREGGSEGVEAYTTTKYINIKL